MSEIRCCLSAQTRVPPSSDSPSPSPRTPSSSTPRKKTSSSPTASRAGWVSQSCEYMQINSWFCGCQQGDSSDITVHQQDVSLSVKQCIKFQFSHAPAEQEPQRKTWCVIFRSTIQLQGKSSYASGKEKKTEQWPQPNTHTLFDITFHIENMLQCHLAVRMKLFEIFNLEKDSNATNIYFF